MTTYAPMRYIDGTDEYTVGDPRVEPLLTAMDNSVGSRVTPSGDTSGAADRAAIQAAINQTIAAGGGIVWLVGTYYINGPVTLGTGVSLRGAGWAGTVIHLAGGSNSSMIVAPADTWWYEVRDMQLDGHRENQTGGAAGIELLSDTAPGPEMASCGVPLIERVLVRYTWGDGIYSKAVEARHVNCFVFRAGRYGFHADRTDMWYTDCTSGESFNHGFYFSAGASECRLSGCKAWWPGYGNDRGKYAWKTDASTLLNPSASSYFIEPGADHQQFVNCESQDAANAGFEIGSHRCLIIGAVNRNEGDTVRIFGGGDRNRLEIQVGNPAPGPASGLWAEPESLVRLDSGAGNNIVHIGWAPPSNGKSIKAGVVGVESANGSNEVIMGTPGTIAMTAYAASFTPDPIQGGVSVTLTGNVTIANTLADRKGHGMEFEVILKQDGTGGRTVTFGADYVGITAADTAANKTNVWRFRCVRDKWVQISHVAY